MSGADNPAVEIRRFQPGDGERVRELNDSAMATTPEYTPDVPDTDLRDVHSNYLDSTGEFLVGVVDGSIVGMGALTPPKEWKTEFSTLDEETIELTRMRVDPGWHGQGVGSRIYHELEHRARHEGYEHIVLDTGVENDVARGFYEDLGFQFEQDMTLSYEEWTFELAIYRKSIVE